MVKALLFDVFGTVVDWEDSVTNQLDSYLRVHSKDVGDVDLRAFTKTWRAGYMRRTREIAGGADGPTNVDELHRELLDELLDAKPAEYGCLSELTDAQRKEVTQFWHRLEGWPDSADGLKKVHDSGVITATLSNGSLRLLVNVARHAHLNFDAIFSGDLLKSYKPNKDMYLGACKLLDLEPQDVGMVASHIYDLRAAGSFGLKTIYVPRKTEDRMEIENFDGPESVRSKAEGGEVDAVGRTFHELKEIAHRL